jgi:terminal uridylyltransferase
MRASRILAARPDRAITALSELCEERRDEELISPPPYVPPRLSLPPQTPYTVGSHPIRPKVSIPEHLSPPTQFFDPALRLPSVPQVPHPPLPAHMAAKRSKWTSPPPPEAPSADHTLFENQLGMGLELATASTEAREREASYTGSSSNSEVFSDEEHPSDPGESDDVLSVRSFTEGSTGDPAVPPRRTLWSHSPESSVPLKPVSSSSLSELSPRTGYRGRLLSRLPERPSQNFHPKITTFIPSHSKSEAARRSVSGPPRTLNGLERSSNAAISTPLSDPPLDIPITVLYETTAIGSPSPTRLHPLSGPNSPLLPRYQTHLTSIGSASQLPQLPDHLIQNPRTIELAADWSGGPSTPTPSTYARSTHSHSQSASTITAPTPPPCPPEPIQASDSSSATPRPQSNSPPLPPEQPTLDQKNGLAFPAASNGTNSPTNSSIGHTTSLSGSPSPPQVIQSAISDGDSQTTSHSDVVEPS